MKLFSHIKISAILILMICGLLCSQKSFATDRVSAATGAWGTAATWNPSGIPAATDNITIVAFWNDENICRHINNWNYKHIVNLERIRLYNSINLRLGYRMIEIINLQPVKSKAKPYQVKQVRNILIQYKLCQ